MKEQTSKKSVSEMAVQQIWAEQDFENENLRTVCGQPLRIEFEGWHNSGSGPDFLEARLQIGDTSLLGAVEIHLHSSGWYAHRHERNPDYNAVVLHVVLYHKRALHGQRKIQREDGREIPELELAPLLGKKPTTSEAQAKANLKKQEALPGHCGAAVAEHGPRAFKELLGHTAEQRIQEKTQRLLERWQEQKPEELLFQLLFKSLGYSAYAQVFEELAKLYPFGELQKFLRQSQRKTRALLLSRWFGACGLFAKKRIIADPTVRREFEQWKADWQALPEKPRISGKLSQAHRPQNAPERRLLGMFHHLQRVADNGLLKSWLVVFRNLSVSSEAKILRKEALRATGNLFATPDWEVWRRHLSFGKSTASSATQLVGQDRQSILWINAILPFFLAYSRYQKETELEKLLYRLFMILPAEAHNKKTRFMQKRLWLSALAQTSGLTANPALNTIGCRQGLIQIQHDFCRNFDQGCVRCELPEILEKTAINLTQKK